MLNYYEQKALLYAEKYGIITYDVKDNFMIWVEEFPIEGSYCYVLNLDTMKTETKKLKNGEEVNDVIRCYQE